MERDFTSYSGIVEAERIVGCPSPGEKGFVAVQQWLNIAPMDPPSPPSVYTISKTHGMSTCFGKEEDLKWTSGYSDNGQSVEELRFAREQVQNGWLLGPSCTALDAVSFYRRAVIL